MEDEGNERCRKREQSRGKKVKKEKETVLCGVFSLHCFMHTERPGRELCSTGKCKGNLGSRGK